MPRAVSQPAAAGTGSDHQPAPTAAAFEWDWPIAGKLTSQASCSVCLMAFLHCPCGRANAVIASCLALLLPCAGVMAKKAQMLAITAAAAAARAAAEGASTASLPSDAAGTSRHCSATTGAAGNADTGAGPEAAASGVGAGMGTRAADSGATRGDGVAAVPGSEAADHLEDAGPASTSYASSVAGSSTGRGGSISSSRQSSGELQKLRQHSQEGGGQQQLAGSKATLLIEYIMLRGVNDTVQDAHR